MPASGPRPRNEKRNRSCWCPTTARSTPRRPAPPRSRHEAGSPSNGCPRYAPELSDIELSWRDLKRHHLARRDRSATRLSSMPPFTQRSMTSTRNGGSTIRAKSRESLLSSGIGALRTDREATEQNRTASRSGHPVPAKPKSAWHWGWPLARKTKAASADRASVPQQSHRHGEARQRNRPGSPPEDDGSHALLFDHRHDVPSFPQNVARDPEHRLSTAPLRRERGARCLGAPLRRPREVRRRGPLRRSLLPRPRHAARAAPIALGGLSHRARQLRRARRVSPR